MPQDPESNLRLDKIVENGASNRDHDNSAPSHSKSRDHDHRGGARGLVLGGGGRWGWGIKPPKKHHLGLFQKTYCTS